MIPHEAELPPAALTGLILACYRRVFRAEVRHAMDTERLVLAWARELRGRGCQLRWESAAPGQSWGVVVNHTVLVWFCATRTLSPGQVKRLRQTVIAQGLAAGLLLSAVGARPLHRRIMAPLTVAASAAG